MLARIQPMPVIENQWDADRKQTLKQRSLTGWNWFDRLIYLMLALSYGTTAGVIVYLLGG